MELARHSSCLSIISLLAPSKIAVLTQTPHAKVVF
jgi:hypothetical protein